MNGTGALRQFVPRSLGIAPGRPLAMASASLLTIRDAEIFGVLRGNAQLAVACNMLPEPESPPRFSAVRIIVVSTTHERIIELLVQGSRATRDGVNEIILPLRCVCN